MAFVPFAGGGSVRSSQMSNKIKDGSRMSTYSRFSSQERKPKPALTRSISTPKLTTPLSSDQSHIRNTQKPKPTKTNPKSTKQTSQGAPR